VSKTMIEVAFYNNPRFAIDAYVFHGWAAHEAIDVDGHLRQDWTVTHVPSGRTMYRATGSLTEEQAIRLAAALGERVRSDIVPEMPREDHEDADSAELAVHVKRVIRSVIFDTLGTVLG
jgi:hypothetical protein